MDSRSVGITLPNRLRDNDKESEALVIGLSGHLGAGKTAFVKCVAKELGIEGMVTSPTFVLMKAYDFLQAEPIDEFTNSLKTNYKPQWPWKKLIHIDAYRLEKREDLERLDWDRLVSDPSNLIMIEWPENVGLVQFKEKAHLKFEIVDGKHLIIIV